MRIDQTAGLDLGLISPYNKPGYAVLCIRLHWECGKLVPRLLMTVSIRHHQHYRKFLTAGGADGYGKILSGKGMSGVFGTQ